MLRTLSGNIPVILKSDDTLPELFSGLGKMIIASSHGSLGREVTDNHLGLTCEAENSQALSKAIDEALSGEFIPDEKYKAFQERLRPEIFTERYRKLYELVKNS